MNSKGLLYSKSAIVFSRRRKDQPEPKANINAIIEVLENVIN